MTQNTHGLTTKDYIYCVECAEFVDFWKYGHDLSATSHSNCKVRPVTQEEFLKCLQDCEKMGCFTEEET